MPQQTAVPIETTPTQSTATLAETPWPKLPAVPVVREEPSTKKAKKQRTKSVASSGAAPASTVTPAPPVAAVSTVVPPPKSGEQAADAASAIPTPTAPVVGGQDSIGVFTVGGDQSPRNKQEAASLIAANDRRLTAESGGHLDPALLSKVRNFQKEAEQALNSGDAEGAKTLATKSKLLLDDLDRGVPSQ